MNVIQDKLRQRNITPNFLRFKRKNTVTSSKKGENDKVETEMPTQRTERSTSKASRCSFDVYERRVLHMSKLKNHLQKGKEEQDSQVRKTNLVTESLKSRKDTTSNEKSIPERQNTMGNTFLIHKLAESKKRNSASGKILLRTNRTPSNPKRSEESLQKQQQRAKKNNEGFMNMMKNQKTPLINNPTLIEKMKYKKIQTTNEKKKGKIRNQKLLNLIVEIKPQQTMKNYEVYGELGKGAYGTVRMGIDKRNNEKVAVKIYEKKKVDEPNKVKNLQREINILAELCHPTIAKLIEVVETSTELFLILEYGGANSLYNYLLSKPQHRLSESQAKGFILVISQTLLYLHNLDIVHRDIKAENILINRHKQLKLIDFGFSLKCKKNGYIDTFCGTPTYMAPEIVSKMDHTPVYTDMWSLGILFYVMLQGNYPFRAKNQNDLFQRIRKGQFQYIYNDTSNQSKKFIEGLLRVNPLQRMTIEDVLSKENKKWLMQEK